MKTYILGIGCRKGVNAFEIEKAAESVLSAYKIKPELIFEIVSCDLKANEKGLLDFAEKWQIPIRFFSLDELENIIVPNPSDKVQEKIGAKSVCEAAAKFAGNGNLVVEKQKFGNITIAIGEYSGNRDQQS